MAAGPTGDDATWAKTAPALDWDREKFYFIGEETRREFETANGVRQPDPDAVKYEGAFVCW